MISYKKGPDFEPHFKKENLAKNLVPIRKSRSIGHIRKAINKISENLFLNDNFKVIKCSEE